MAKKTSETISFLTNERLFIYNASERIFYYINDYKNTPFKSTIPPHR